MYFPVRSAYFYDRLDGLVVNAIMSGLAMYPPVFRDPRRRHLNRHTIDFLAGELQRPGTIVGLHPEGRRGTGADPYTLLPAHPGIGEMVHRARPLVLPVFILGLSNNLGRQVRGNFNGQGPPVTITFGSPVNLDEQLVLPARARTYLAIAERIREEITALGVLDRQAREATGDVPAQRPRSDRAVGAADTRGARASSDWCRRAGCSGSGTDTCYSGFTVAKMRRSQKARATTLPPSGSTTIRSRPGGAIYAT